MVGWVSTETTEPPALVELLDRDDGFRELHEREEPLHHARASRGETDTSVVPARGPLAGSRELLPDAALRAAHEREVHDREAERSLDRRASATIASPSPVSPSASASCPCTDGGRRSERVGGAQALVLLHERVGSASCDPLAGAGGKVVPAPLADTQVLGFVLPIVGPEAGTGVGCDFPAGPGPAHASSRRSRRRFVPG